MQLLLMGRRVSPRIALRGHADGVLASLRPELKPKPRPARVIHQRLVAPFVLSLIMAILFIARHLPGGRK